MINVSLKNVEDDLICETDIDTEVERSTTHNNRSKKGKYISAF